MKQIKSWWRTEPRGRKVLFGTAAGVLAVLIVATLAVLFIPNNEETKATDSADTNVSTPSPDGGSAGDEPESADSESPVEGRWDAENMPLTYDSDGMVEMPVTQDPFEAAAAAAAVAYSVDTTKVSWEEYVDTAVTRMTHWNEEGPVDGLHGPTSGDIGHFLIDDEWLTLPPWQHTLTQVQGWQRANPDYWNWWHLSQETHFAELALVDATWAAQPLEVYDTIAMLPLGVEGVNRDADRDWEPDTPGATLGDYWVSVKLEESYEGHIYNESMRYAVVSIWCDAPEDGGLCAVAEAVDGPMPEKWQG